MPRHDYDVIIVGGGFAGVTAARDLGKSGRRVLLIEARDRLGGRTWYRDDLLEGYSIEMGGGWIGEDEEFVMAEVERYGIELNRDGDPPTRLIWTSANGVRESVLPVPFEQLPDLERALAHFGNAAARVDLKRPISSQELQEFDVPLPEFVADLNLPVETRDLLAGFWGGVASADWADMSALLAINLQATAGGTFFDYLNTVMLGPRFRHGTGRLVEAIFEDSGADLSLSEPVQSILTQEDSVLVRTAGRDIRATAVVCAVPLNVLDEIAFTPALSAPLHRAATVGHSGRGFKLWMVVRNVGGAMYGLGAPGPFNHLFTVEERGEESLLCGFGFAGMPDADDIPAVQEVLRRYVPEAEVVAATTHDWLDDPFAKGTWFVYPADFIAEYEAALSEAEGRVILAGADVSKHRPGYIDGAIESGRRAAESVAHFVD